MALVAFSWTAFRIPCRRVGTVISGSSLQCAVLLRRDFQFPDSRGLVPGGLHLFRDRVDRGDFEPQDRSHLKPGGEPSARFRPREVGLTTSVFGTVDPGNPGLDPRGIPTGVEVPPRTLALVVVGAFRVIFLAPGPPEWLMSQSQGDPYLSHLVIHLFDVPGSGQAKPLFKDFFLSHDGRVLKTSLFFALS